jgi:hypothetical protein
MRKVSDFFLQLKSKEKVHSQTMLCNIKYANLYRQKAGKIGGTLLHIANI